MLFSRKTYDSFAGGLARAGSSGRGRTPTSQLLGDARKFVVSNQELEFTGATPNSFRATSSRPSPR